MPSEYRPPNPQNEANAPVPRAQYEVLVAQVDALRAEMTSRVEELEKLMREHRHGYRWESTLKEGDPLLALYNESFDRRAKEGQ